MNQKREWDIISMPCFLFFRIKGTVIVRIWWQLVLVALYTAVVVWIHLYQLKMEFDMSLIPILGAVIGLLLVFRTNTAYDRYWEGRKLWSEMINGIRILTRGIWVGVSVSTAKDVIEKKSVVNILVAFAIATKHYLREEYAYGHEDLQSLIGYLPSFSTPSSNQPLTPRKKPARRGTFWLTAYEIPTPTNIPIELSYYIATYLRSVNTRGAVEPPLLANLYMALTRLTDCLTGFERILRTPIPLAYSVHLHYCVWMYLLSIPYQVVNALEWWTIPVVTLASFALLGILGIGWEIENPFGFDANDLPLDDFCDVIKREIQMIIGSNVLQPEEWVFAEGNHPFHQLTDANAAELSKKSMVEINQILHDEALAVINKDIAKATSQEKRKTKPKKQKVQPKKRDEENPKARTSKNKPMTRTLSYAQIMTGNSSRSYEPHFPGK